MWTPMFPDFLHEYLAVAKTATDTGQPAELIIGEGIQAAVHKRAADAKCYFSPVHIS